MERRPELRIFRRTRHQISRKQLFFILCSGIQYLVTLICSGFRNSDNPSLCWINWRGVCYGVYWFGSLIVGLVLTSIRKFLWRYGFTYVSLLVLSIPLLSCALVAVVLNGGATYGWRLIENNLIKRLDESIVVIDETRNVPFTFENKNNRLLSKWEEMRYSGEDVRFICNKQLTYEEPILPHQRIVLWKHDGEQIKQSPRIWVEHQFSEIDLDPSEQSSVNETKKTAYKYNVTSTLTITLIEESDYGNYSCYVSTFARRMHIPPMQNSRDERAENNEIPSKVCSTFGDFKTVRKEIIRVIKRLSEKEEFIEKQLKLLEVILNFDTIDVLRIKRSLKEELENIRKLKKNLKDFLVTIEMMFLELSILAGELYYVAPPPYEWTAEFTLAKLPKRRIIVQAPPGGVVSLSATYMNMANMEDISMGYTINNIDILNVCNGLFNGCSKFVFFYWLFLHDGGHVFNMPMFSSYYLGMGNSISGTAWQCVCPEAYGSHKFRFYRHYYNQSSQRNTVVEVEYPHLIELVPRTPDLFDSYGNSTTTLLTEEACWSNENTVVQPSCSHSEKVRQFITENFFFKENIFFYGAAACCIFIPILCYLLLLRKLLLTIRNFILERRWRLEKCGDDISETLGSVCRVDTNTIIYDIFVSNTPEEDDFALNIASLFESYGQKVFVRDRDILGGEVITEAVSNAIVKSRKAVVILTPEYIRSGHQNGFEFQLIWERVRDGFIREKDMLLLVYRPCDIPSVFMQFTILIWEENHRGRDICHELKLWAGKSAFKEDGATINTKFWHSRWRRVKRVARSLYFHMFVSFFVFWFFSFKLQGSYSEMFHVITFSISGQYSPLFIF